MKRLIQIGSVLVLLVCLCLSLACCANSSEDIPDGMQIASSNGDAFRLYVPTSWNSTADMGTAGAYYLTSVLSNVSVRELDSSAQTLAQFCEECIASYRDRFGEGYDQRALDNGFLGGEDAKCLQFTATVVTPAEGDTPEVRDTYRVYQVMTRHEGKYYQLTLCMSSDASTDELYDQCLGDVAKMIEVFRFAEPYKAGEVRKISASAAPEGMQNAASDKVPYRFYVPTAWTVDTHTAVSAAYVSETDKSNVSVTAYLPETNMNLTELKALCMKEYAQYLGDVTEITASAKDDATMGNRPAVTWEFTATTDGVTYRYRQTAVVINGFLNSAFYLLTYTAKDEVFASHLDDVLAMEAAFAVR